MSEKKIQIFQLKFPPGVKIEYKKENALKRIKENQKLYGVDIKYHYYEKDKKGKKIYFFDEDEKPIIEYKKNFFNADKTKICELLSKDDYYIYEHYGYEKNQPVKFFIDTEYEILKKEKNKYTYFPENKNAMKNEVINVVDKYLIENGFETDKIILDASTNIKFSYHIIYQKIVFENIDQMKLFIGDFVLKTNDKYRGIIDTCVYCNRCFRCINQSKLDKKNPLKSIKDNDINIEDTLLLYVDPKLNVFKYEQKIEPKKNENNNTYAKEQVIRGIKPTNMLNVNMEKQIMKMNQEMANDFLSILNASRFESHNTWMEILFCLKCENTDEYYELFDSFSKPSGSYNEAENLKKWKSYDPTKTKNRITYNSLKYWAKIDNPEGYDFVCKKHGILQEKEEKDIELENVLEIEQEYLLMERKITNCVVSKYLTKFFESDTKSLMIKSPYNTGKTTFLENICAKFERIIFISYRVTLSNNVNGVFGKLGFKMYNENINADRLICQIDSLAKINYPEYDLVIIDESESALNHFSSDYLKNKNGLFQEMVSMCFNAQKIIALDGDLANRTKTFIEGFGSNMFINNKIKKDYRKFLFCNNEDDFKEEISKELEEEKNICIVSMHECQANFYYKLFGTKYKAKMYTGKTSDSEKKLLADVTKVWKECQLLIYNPTIESGVDFNEDHFYKIYVIMGTNSTSPRGLYQMIHRVRKIQNPNIKCLLNGILPNVESKFRHYSFEEVKAFYKDLAGENSNFVLKGDKLVVDKEYSFDMYDVIMMYNKLEYLNKNVNCFLPEFIKMINRKGHEYVFIGDGKGEKEEITSVVMEKIIDAKKITSAECLILQNKQAKQELNEDEKYQITKFMYEKTFGIEIKDVETLKIYYNKLGVIKNAKNLIDDNYIEFNDSKIRNKEHVKKIIEVRNLLKIIGVDTKDLQKNSTKITKDAILDQLEPINNLLKKNKIMFGFSKTFDIDSSQKLFPTLKKIFENYGIEMEKPSKNSRYYDLYFDENVKNKLDVEALNSLIK